MYTLFRNLHPKTIERYLNKCNLSFLFKMCIKAEKATKYVEVFVQTLAIIRKLFRVTIFSEK